MARLLTAAEMAEQALAQVGVFSVYDSGPDAASFDRTLLRLDLLLSETVGSYNFWWFTPVSEEISVNVNQVEYDLNALLDSDLQFIQHAFLVRNGKQTELTQLRRSKYDEMIVDQPAPGTPTACYIDRNNSPTLHLVPASSLEGDMLLLTGQKYSPDVTQDAGQIAHEFPAAWQRALLLQLSADIGSGPVIKLPRDELQDLKKDAGTAFRRLDAYNNREQVRKPRFVKPRSF